MVESVDILIAVALKIAEQAGAKARCCFLESRLVARTEERAEIGDCENERKHQFEIVKAV